MKKKARIAAVALVAALSVGALAPVASARQSLQETVQRTAEGIGEIVSPPR